MLHSITVGDDPPVVLISALGFGGSVWRPVLDRLTTGTTTVTYDRPGCGAAPPRSDPKRLITYDVLAGELDALLTELGVIQPAVIVGHSMGGNIARVLAARRPIAGLVFVDCSSPGLLLGDERGPLFDGEDDEKGNEIDVEAGEEEVLAAGVPTVPAIALSRTPGWAPEFDELWTAHQLALASTYHAPLIVADDSGHHLPADAPGLVAYGIDLIVRCVRDGTRPDPDRQKVAAAGGHLAD